MSKQELELPKGWAKTKLDDFTILIQGQSPPGSTYNDKGDGLPFFQGKAEFNELYPTIKKWCTQPKKIAEKDDILLCVRAGTGAVNFNPEKSCIGRGIAAIRTLCDVPPFYIINYLKIITEEFRGQGTTITGITSSDLKNLQIPIAPLKEQKRITSKIEELFSKIDSITQSLEHTTLQLEQYRNSLLKSVFEGKLTEDWRKKENPSLDTLLEKIQSNRKNQESKLQKLKPFDDDAPFSIPSVWAWTRVGLISNEIQYGTSEKASTTKSKLPVLRMGNIQDGVLNFEKLKYYPNKWKSRKQYLLKDGDVLFNRTNSAELVGKSAIYREFHPIAVFAGYLIRVKIFDEIYSPLLLTWYLNSIFGKLYVKSVVSQQVGQANVNGTKLAMMHLPLMSNEEQKEIINILEQGFSLIQNTHQTVNSTLEFLQTMKMSILKQAFEGKLVPQDSDDESAEILLQKIKQEKQQLIQKQKTKRRSKNVK